MRHFFVENEDQPCQASWFAVSYETTFFTVSGGGCNASGLGPGVGDQGVSTPIL